MKLLWFLVRGNTRQTVAVLILGLISGVASGALIAVVNNALYANQNAGHMRSLMALAFLAIVVIKVGSSLASNLMLGYSLQDIILKLCARLCRKVADTPYRDLELVGAAGIMTCLTDDVAILSAAIQILPALIINLAVLASCTVYLAWISWYAALLLVLLVAIIAVMYRLLMSAALHAIQRARDGRDVLFRNFRSLVEGIKELQLHQGKRQLFFEKDLDASAEFLRQQNVIAMKRYSIADGWSQTMFYSLLAVVLFAVPVLHQATVKTLTAYIFVALYAMSPVWGIIAAVPAFNRGRISLDKLEALGLQLSDLQSSLPPEAEASPSPVSRFFAGKAAPLVEFRQVVFSYSSEEGPHGFTFGPVDLTLYPNELVFIIGGNGSGKSTLAKLLTGLYTPQSGEILIDGARLAAEHRSDYRQLFSAVFSDFYLFDRLAGRGTSEELQTSAREYLEVLDLSRKVQVNNGSFSTTALSQGQRRRLALLASYLEDRPIYVLDEWAADQDPGFRQIFYLKLLPELKRKGKTVVVITHDDRFFHLGDRVIKLEYGKVAAESQSVQPAESLHK